jgi:hypothetical protein
MMYLWRKQRTIKASSNTTKDGTTIQTTRTRTRTRKGNPYKEAKKTENNREFDNTLNIICRAS